MVRPRWCPDSCRTESRMVAESGSSSPSILAVVAAWRATALICSGVSRSAATSRSGLPSSTAIQTSVRWSTVSRGAVTQSGRAADQCGSHGRSPTRITGRTAVSMASTKLPADWTPVATNTRPPTAASSSSPRIAETRAAGSGPGGSACAGSSSVRAGARGSRDRSAASHPTESSLQAAAASATPADPCGACTQTNRSPTSSALATVSKPATSTGWASMSSGRTEAAGRSSPSSAATTRSGTRQRRAGRAVLPWISSRPVRRRRLFSPILASPSTEATAEPASSSTSATVGRPGPSSPDSKPVIRWMVGSSSAAAAATRIATSTSSIEQ